MRSLLNNRVVQWVLGILATLVTSAVCAAAGMAVQDHERLGKVETKSADDHEMLIYIRDRSNAIYDYLLNHK